MQIKRRFTTAGKSPYDKIPFRRATSEIKNPDGSVVFRQENFAVPEHWSQVAADILAQKYFRKAGVPARLRAVPEADLPDWLCRHEADETALIRHFALYLPLVFAFHLSVRSRTFG